MELKRCPDCRRDLSLSDFTKNRRSRDGLAFYCRTCASERAAASRRRRSGPPRRRDAARPKDLPDGSKWCPECNEVKPLGDFPRNRSQRTGYGTYCKPCHNRITRANRDAHGGARNYHLRRRYGIAVEHYDAMFEEQQGLCAICRDAPAAHVDHDHATGRVRGLLCFNCNGALGQFRDRADLMMLAVHYLERGAEATYTRPPGVVVGFAPEYEDPRPPGEPRDVPPSMIA